MKHQNIYTVPYRRKREGKTNYAKRIKLVASGKPRLVVRKTLSKLMVQIVEFGQKGDIIKMGVDSTELLKHGWKGSVKNVPAAYLTGYMLAKKAVKNKIHEAVLDIGFNTSTKGCKVFAALNGAIDGGLKVPSSEEIFPSKDRIEGKHIKNFSNKVEEIKGKLK